MKLSSSKEGAIRYFSAKLGWKERFNPKEIDMLSSGVVPMLIPPVAIQGRKNNIIQYDISSYSTLEFYLSCILSREQFAQLLLQCINLFRQMQQVYLNYKNLVLNLEQIYVLLADRTLHFIYLPLLTNRPDVSIPQFFRKMIQKASRSTYEQSSFLDHCLAWLDRPAPFILNEFETLIYDCSAVNDTTVDAQQSSRAFISTSSAAVIPPVAQNFKAYQPVPQNGTNNQLLSFASREGTTSLLNGHHNGGTVLLANGSETKTLKFFLIREKNNDRVTIIRSPFLVGSEAGSVDYYIADNPAVSRKHANFIFQDGKCAIIDLNSTNRTYINNCALEPDVPVFLKEGDRVRLANEYFIFTQEE